LVNVILKREGITPLQAIQEYKEAHPELAAEKISYAGRLDPMASGLLILLIGEANKEREQFLHQYKTYEIDILWGIETDSFDVLGMPGRVSIAEVEKDAIQASLESFKGVIIQKYPPYSSKPVNGRPLYYWARQGKLDEIEMPSQEREIFSIEMKAARSISGEHLLNDIIARIKNVQGDFRQEAIMQAWQSLLPEYASHDFMLTTLEVHGSSGLYMRQLAVDIGEVLNMPTLAYRIVRTSVGSINNPSTAGMRPDQA
jgi:tRNA pseudouridine55 synthase